MFSQDYAGATNGSGVKVVAMFFTRCLEKIWRDVLTMAIVLIFIVARVKDQVA
jgi:hypothetical protein